MEGAGPAGCGVILIRSNSRRWKAPRSAGQRDPSRGRVEARISVGSWGRREHPARWPKDRRHPRGARVTKRGGEPTSASACGSKQSAHGVLHSRWLGPCSPSAVTQRLPPQAVVGSRRRPQATSRWGDGFRGTSSRWFCDIARRTSKRLPRLVASTILLREGKVAPPKEAREGDTGSSPSKRRLEWTRDPDALERVRASKWSCRYRWAVVGSRKARVGALRENRKPSRRGRGSSSQ